MSRWMVMQSWQGLLVLVILCIKLPFLIAYGPTVAPDSGGYIVYAQSLLKGVQPHLEMHTFSDSMVFRAVGYPAVIAVAMVLAGSAWPWLVVALQIALTLIVAGLIAQLVLRLSGSVRWALAGGLAYAISLPLVLDQMILTDSLAGSCLALPACLLALRIQARQRLTVGAALGLGLMVAAAFLVREATVFFAGLGLLPMALAAAFADRLPLHNLSALRPQFWRRAFTAVAVILPMLCSFQAYRLWNQSRLGVPFVTVAAQTTILQAMAKVGQEHPEVFDRNRLIDRVALDTFKTFEFAEVWVINQRLYSEHGMTVDRIAAAAYDSYFHAWLREPLLMLRIPLYHVRPSFARAWLQPVQSALLLNTWATEQGRVPSLRRAIMAGQWQWTPVFLLDVICIIVATPVFLVFMLITPLRVWREGLTPANAVGIGFWALFVAFYGGYAMVHLEPRYLLGVMAGVTVVGITDLASAWRWFVARRHQRRLQGVGR